MDDHLLRLQREAVTQFMRMDEDLTAEDSEDVTMLWQLAQKQRQLALDHLTAEVQQPNTSETVLFAKLGELSKSIMTFCDVPMNASQTWSSQVSLNTPFDDSQQSGQLQQMSQLETPTNIPHFMPADFLLVPSKSLVDTRGPPALNQEGQGSLQNMSLGTSGISVSQGADGLVGQAASMTDGTGMTQRRFRLNSVSIDALSNNQQQVNNPAVSTSAGVTSSTGSIGHLAVPGNIVLPNVAHSASPLRQLVSESTSLSPTSRVKHRLGAPTPTNPNHRAKTALSIVTSESSQAGRSPGGGAALSADPNMAVPGGHFRARSKSVQYFSTLNRMNPLQTSTAGGTGMGGTNKLVPTTEDMGLTSQDSFTGS